MDFKELRYITEIAKQGSISKAAESLGISQPSLSKFLQNIEKINGVSLFKRAYKGLVPTDAGERYIELAEQILSLAENMESGYLSGDAGSVESLSVILPPGKGFMFTDIIADFMGRFPGTALSFYESDPDGLAEMVLSGETDIAVTRHKIAHDKIYAEKLLDEELVLMMPDRSAGDIESGVRPAFESQFANLENFKHKNIAALYTDPEMKEKIVALVKREKIDPHLLILTNNLSTIRNVMLEKENICLLPQSFTGYINPVRPLVYFPVRDRALRSGIYYVCRKSGRGHSETQYLEQRFRALWPKSGGQYEK